MTTLESSDSFLSQASCCDQLGTTAEVVVIGAGLSGLTAAHRILQKDPALRVVVLEATDCVGGRTQTVKLKVSGECKEPFDVGGQWICSRQKDILLLIEELKISTLPQYKDGQKVCQIGNNFKIHDCQVIPACSWYSSFDIYWFVKKVENIIEKINWRHPEEDVFAVELDSMTLDTFLNMYLNTQMSVGILTSLVQSSLGAEPYQVSALFFVAFVNGTKSFLSNLQRTFPGDKEQRIMNGAQSISEKLASELASCLKLGDPVKEVVQVENMVHIITENQKHYRCEYAIVAIPPNEIAKIVFSPPLPPQHKKFLEHYPAGKMIKIVVTYTKAFWRDKNLSGESLSDGGQNPEEFPLSMTFDLSTANDKAAIGGYITGRQMDSFCVKNAQERKQSVLCHLCKLFGDDALQPIDYVEKNWCEEPFVGGCPIQYRTPGGTECMFFMKHPFGRIHWAGTEAATSWFGYMNGAVQAANKAALGTLYELRPQSLSAFDLEEVHKSILRVERPSHVHWKIFMIIGFIGLGFTIYRFRHWFWFSRNDRLQ